MTTAPIVQSDDLITIETPPVVLAFRWDGRRWSHDLSCAGVTIASSVEWEPERDDPTRVVSPTYQQLSTQETASGRQALLVGQWGQNHGSAVYTVSEASPGVVVVEADLAVRSRTPIQALASTYFVPLTSSHLCDANASTIVWNLEPQGQGRVTFEAGASSTQICLAEAGRSATRVQAVATLVPASATQRLVYRWTWVRA